MFFTKIIFQNTYVELETPSPPLHGKNPSLNFHFDYWNPSLMSSAFCKFYTFSNPITIINVIVLVLVIVIMIVINGIEGQPATTKSFWLIGRLPSIDQSGHLPCVQARLMMMMISSAIQVVLMRMMMISSRYSWAAPWLLHCSEGPGDGKWLFGCGRGCCQ